MISTFLYNTHLKLFVIVIKHTSVTKTHVLALLVCLSSFLWLYVCIMYYFYRDIYCLLYISNNVYFLYMIFSLHKTPKGVICLETYTLGLMNKHCLCKIFAFLWFMYAKLIILWKFMDTVVSNRNLIYARMFLINFFLTIQQLQMKNISGLFLKSSLCI